MGEMKWRTFSMHLCKTLPPRSIPGLSLQTGDTKTGIVFHLLAAQEKILQFHACGILEISGE